MILKSPPVSRVSVIIPNYNRAALIGETISNLLRQTRPPHEIIVVDDGSTDDSTAVIRSFGEKITLIQQSNQGPGAARNTGLKIAASDFIQFQDSDDLLSLNKLEAQTAALEKNGADIALSPWAHVQLSNRQLKFDTCVLQQSLPPSRISLSCWLLRGWSTIFQSAMFRRSFLKKLDGYRTDVWYGEDMEFLFRMLTMRPSVVFAAEALTLYRSQSPNKLSEDGGLAKPRRIIDWAKCLLSMIEHQKQTGFRPDWITRSIFLSSVRKHLRYLHTVSTVPRQISSRLTEETKALPETWLLTVELWLRLLERVRLARTGYRWMSGYRAAPASSQQRALITELGFEAGLSNS